MSEIFIFENVCHRNADKLVEISGFSSKVCFRCSGIYLGALFASAIILFASIKLNTIFFQLSLIIIIVDVVGINLDFFEYNGGFAFFSGFLLGSFSYILLNDVISNYEK